MTAKRIIAAVGLLGLVAGCKAEVGATIFSALDAGSRASIGLLVDCEFDRSTPVLVAAGLRYYDPTGPREGPRASHRDSRPDVRIHGRVERVGVDGVGGICLVDPGVAMTADQIVIEGRYWPLPGRTSGSGRFRIDVQGPGTPGFGGDDLRIVLTGGAFDGYENQGILNDARITYVDEETHLP